MDYVASEALEQKSSDLESAGGLHGREAPIEMKDRSVFEVGAEDAAGIVSEDRQGEDRSDEEGSDVAARDRRRTSTSTGMLEHAADPSHSSSTDHLPTTSTSTGPDPESAPPITRAPSRSRHTTRPQSDIMPAAIGRETCPICIFDFEEGDDLRVLPCEGKHAFHQTCVDPWLLELSSSCPICRQGECHPVRFRPRYAHIDAAPRRLPSAGVYDFGRHAG